MSRSNTLCHGEAGERMRGALVVVFGLLLLLPAVAARAAKTLPRPSSTAWGATRTTP